MNKSAPMHHAHRPSSNRRTWLQQALVLGGAALTGTATLGLNGCGFQLRGQHRMAFASMQLTGFAANSLLATELARALDANGVKILGSTLEATQAASSTQVPASHLVFEALRDSRDMVVASTTSYSQVRTMTARISLRFQVKRADGTTLLRASDITLSRDLTYNEKDALAKQDESAALHKAMQTDIVDQVLRRLEHITPDQLATPAQAPYSASASASEPDRRVPTPQRPSASSAR
jgi:LPS-assembly lipoprotein